MPADCSYNIIHGAAAAAAMIYTRAGERARATDGVFDAGGDGGVINYGKKESKKKQKKIIRKT